MKAFKWLDDINWDRMGIGLSFLCTIHCLVTPFVLISLHILARYYLSHPIVHLILALAILPVGVLAFLSGYRHHASPWALILGVPGLLIVAIIPYLAHVLFWNVHESVWMLSGSAMLISAHLLNRRACRVQHGSHAAHSPHSHVHSTALAETLTAGSTELSQ